MCAGNIGHAFLIIVQLVDQLLEVALAGFSKLSARRLDEPGDLGMHSPLLKKSDL